MTSKKQKIILALAEIDLRAEARNYTAECEREERTGDEAGVEGAASLLKRAALNYAQALGWIAPLLLALLIGCGGSNPPSAPTHPREGSSCPELFRFECTRGTPFTCWQLEEDAGFVWVRNNAITACARAYDGGY